MAERIEARSLASLNLLAANPPQYPSAPVSQRQDPVVLYISRVPGSRDIILSTQKPQLKNVTADDVARSLYYVHLNSPEDDLLIPLDHQNGSQSPRSSSESQPIRRKPLASQGSSQPGTNAVQPQVAAPTQVYEAYHPPSNGSCPPPAPPPHLDNSHISNENSASRSFQPRARKPVPLGIPLNAASTRQAQVSEEPNPALPPRNYLTSRSPSPNSRLVPPQTRSRPASPSRKKKPFHPFSLTLIRRDPTQGQQWNVGQVASYQMEDIEHPEEESPSAYPSPSISIHLETSGYAKFRGMPTRPSMGTVDVRHSFDGRPDDAGTAFLSTSYKQQTTSLQGGFDREVMMSYTPSFSSNIKHIFGGGRPGSKGADDAAPPAVQQVIRPGHSRAGSAGSVSFFSGFSGSKPIITKAAAGLRPRGYVFMSPWDGRCEFVTGNAGRSLRCNHILPQIGGAAAYNPLVDGDDGEAGNRWPAPNFPIPGGVVGNRRNQNVRAVSELRFNLPSSELLSSRDKRDRATSLEGGAARARDQLQSQFNKVVQSIENHANGQGPFGRHDSDEDFYDEDGRLNLSLGQEKAGGGNRGKRAKMGKLIIAEDGLKMLDLVVAANVGLWWASWEKSA
ncbi:mitogen-activated protein kinase 7 [Microdochium nivale]|nr:mitogen-activated protein kinase 7 [Microdochium nivale]